MTNENDDNVSTTDDQNSEKKMEIISTEDERLKTIGEILSNETSRTILRLLITHDMTTHEIVKKTGISLSLTLHHIGKMLNVKLIEISRISKSSKGQDMKHYSAKQGIMILTPISSQKAKCSKTFQKSLKKIMKFGSIGIAGITSWFAMQSLQIKSVRPTLPSEQIPPEIFLGELFWPTVASLIVIITGLVIERIASAIKNK